MKSFYLLIVLLFFNCLISYGQWQVQLSNSENVANPVSYPLWTWYPDGHISVVPDGSEYIMFWAEFESHRSIGTTQFVDGQYTLQPSNSVFGSRGNFNTYDNGGSWLMSVLRKPNNLPNSSDFIGFYHAEDHWYPHTSNDIAWKSIGVTYSKDKGKTWEIGKQIITSSTPKPALPAWGGTGDSCVVWDHINNRWMCYYQEHTISMAISTDPEGAPGTWKKYTNLFPFTEDGLGGFQSPLPNLSSVPGGNPSVHWNTYLNKWVMVWHGWSPANIYISVSANGINWDTPKMIIVSEQGGKAWYPTIIGVTDVEAGRVAKIYYADFATNGSRKFKSRTITFFDPSLSVDEKKLENDFLLSPCPSYENIKLSGLPFGNKEVFIYNMSGQLVYKGAFEDSNVEIDINKFSSGLYNVKVRVGNQSLNKQFVKH